MFTILPGYGRGRILALPVRSVATYRLPRARGHLHRGGAPRRARLRRRPRSSRWVRWSRSWSRSGRASVDLGFVPLENAIEGTVRDIIDSLVFDFDLRIQREVVLDIHLHLMARSGDGARRHRAGGLHPRGHRPVPQVPHRASSQRPSRWPPTRRPRRPACWVQDDPALTARPTAAIAPRLAAKLYGLEILVEDVEDHPDNQTRFVVAGQIRHPGAHRPRPDQHRLLPERRPSGQPLRHPRPVRGPEHQPEQARIPTDQEGAGRLLLHHRLRGSRRRRRGRRLPARPPRRAGRGQVPRVVPGGRAGRPGHPARGGHLAAAGRRVGRRAAGRDRTAVTGVPDRTGRMPRRPTTLARARRDGRADKCAALEKP